jgi:erythrin-vacuolar iron transport family protein
MQKNFKNLTEREILALAIQNEEEDGRIYGEFADALRESYPATADMFEEMRVEEAGHRDRLFEQFRGRFGEHIPPIRREDVKGFLQRRPLWLVRPLGVNAARKHAQVMEMEAVRFYQRAADRVTHAGTRELLNKLADEERKHTETAGNLQEKHLTEHARAAEAESHKKLFLLQVIQPGLAGLMDGSVSTLAPLFAAAYASHKTWEAFLVGMAASLGAGIWKYIAADNLDAADHVVAEIQEAIRTLVPFPHLGHQRPDLTSRPLRFHRYEISLRMRLTNNPS